MVNAGRGSWTPWLSLLLTRPCCDVEILLCKSLNSVLLPSIVWYKRKFFSLTHIIINGFTSHPDGRKGVTFVFYHLYMYILYNTYRYARQLSNAVPPSRIHFPATALGVRFVSCKSYYNRSIASTETGYVQCSVNLIGERYLFRFFIIFFCPITRTANAR